jgi:hypothetical protein
LVARPAAECDTNYRYIEVTAGNHGVKSGEDLLVGKISRRSKEHQCVTLRGFGHSLMLFLEYERIQAFFSW